MHGTISRRRLLLGTAIGSGVVRGLEVHAEADAANLLQIEAGLAITGCGEPLALDIEEPQAWAGVADWCYRFLTHLEGLCGFVPMIYTYDAYIRERVLRRDVAALVDYRRQAPHAARAHPTEDHYLPLLHAAGAADAKDPVRFFNANYQSASISMRSVVWG